MTVWGLFINSLHSINSNCKDLRSAHIRTKAVHDKGLLELHFLYGFDNLVGIKADFQGRSVIDLEYSRCVEHFYLLIISSQG